MLRLSRAFESRLSQLLHFVSEAVDRPSSVTLALEPALRAYNPKTSWGAETMARTDAGPQAWRASGHVSHLSRETVDGWMEGLLSMPHAREAYGPIFALFRSSPRAGGVET